MKDREIIALFDSRDQRAIDEAEKKYGRYCRTVAMSVLDNEADAEECVNDGLLKAWNSIPPALPERLDQYLGGLVRNCAIDRLRRRQSLKSRPEGGLVSMEEIDRKGEAVTDPWTDPLGIGKGDTGRMIADGIDPEGGRMLALMEEYLRSIDQKKRKIFFGRYYYDRSVEDIARIMDIPKGTVLSSLNRTREGLRKFLESRGIEI